MVQHSVSGLAVRLYADLLISLGQVGFGWLLISQAKNMVSFFIAGKMRSAVSRILVICGWISLAFGGLVIATFLILMAVIAFRSL
jgi:hypothetical protein